MKVGMMMGAIEIARMLPDPVIRENRDSKFADVVATVKALGCQ
jgi:hypothetical protein